MAHCSPAPGWPLTHAGYSKFARRHYASEGLYPAGTSTWLMFGAETTGLPEASWHCRAGVGGCLAQQRALSGSDASWQPAPALLLVRADCGMHVHQKMLLVVCRLAWR